MTLTLLVTNAGVYVCRDGVPIYGPVSAYQAGWMLVKLRTKEQR